MGWTTGLLALTLITFLLSTGIIHTAGAGLASILFVVFAALLALTAVVRLLRGR